MLSRLNLFLQVFLQPRDMNAYCLNVKLVYNSSLPHQCFQTTLVFFSHFLGRHKFLGRPKSQGSPLMVKNHINCGIIDFDSSKEGF